MKRLSYEHGRDVVITMTKNSKFEITRDENDVVIVKLFSKNDDTQEIGQVELSELQNILFTRHDTK